eukprot:scaffold22205_cov36-Phaeocystis_antarctica.AAC.1
MSTPCSTRSRHVAPDDVGRESPQLTRSTWSSRGSRLGASWPGLAANRYTSSSDQLRAALLKLRPAGRRDRHGWRRTPPCPPRTKQTFRTRQNTTWDFGTSRTCSGSA